MNLKGGHAKAFLLTLIIGAAAEAGANEITPVGDVDITGGFSTWAGTLAENASAQGEAVLGYAECAGVTELDNTYLCGYYSYVEMNDALARASTYAEGLFNTPQGTVVATNSGAYRMARSSIAGHDLRAHHLKAFWEDVKEQCDPNDAKRKLLCPTPAETALFDGYLAEKFAANEPFVIITFALRSPMSYMDVVTHEVMHAQYFVSKDQNYARIVKDFWENEVSAADRPAITSILASMYNVSDEVLLHNEFQAYILMAGAERSFLANYIDKYREPLTQALRAEGIEPIQVH